jgi:hypothetical protein
MEELKIETVAPPIPVTGPDGRLFGYACPRCLHYRCGIEGGTLESRVEYSLEYASTCCLCPSCGVEKKKGNWILNSCKPCYAKQQKEWATHLEETRPQREAEEARREAAITQSKDRNSADLLQRLMSDISEEYYCAGWLTGLEFELWAMVQGGKRAFGMSEVTESEVAQLKQLSEQCGGWWYFNDEDGETFITLEDWKARTALAAIEV